MKKQLLALVLGAAALQVCATSDIANDDITPENVVTCVKELVNKKNLTVAEAKNAVRSEVETRRDENKITLEQAEKALEALNSIQETQENN